MKIKEGKAFWANIYIAGDPATAKQVCREYCFDIGLCVTVSETIYIYTGGEEFGVVIGLVNYPRFPSTPDEIIAKAEELGTLLMEKCFQTSFMVQTPAAARWHTRRDDKG